MFKALLKKQFLELNAVYFQNRKTGKMRSKKGTVGFIILWIFLFALIGSAFYGVSDMLCGALTYMGFDWLYFTIMGLLAIVLGVFGAVFNTYAGLYQAKDNDLLLSMPIPPSRILAARMTGVYAMGILYEAIIYIPAIICYWINGKPTALSVIFSVLLFFVTGFFILTLTCALGWVVALISGKFKNKSFITVLASLIFFAAYYFVYFRINEFLQTIVSNADIIGNRLKGGILYPFYLMGLAGTGKALPMLAVTAAVAVLTALTAFVLSRTFIKIATAKTAEKKKEYKEQTAKASGYKTALLRKELKRFTSSPTYMLNCGLGLIIMPLIAIAALIKADLVRETMYSIGKEIPELLPLFPVFAAALVCIMLSMNAITAPSVSLEGKNIWIVQSLPLKAADVLYAKEKLHILLNAVPTVISAIILGIVIEADYSAIASIVILSFIYIRFCAAFGLLLNIKAPNLNWTNEVIPVKQGISIMITLFSGWGISVAFAAAGYFLTDYISAVNYILCAAVVFYVATYFINKWIFTKGAQIFAEL